MAELESTVVFGDLKITGDLIVRNYNADLWNGYSIGTLPVTKFLKENNAAEGGQIYLERATGSTLGGDVTIDNLNNLIRLFEMGGSYRGAYLDLGTCAGSVGSILWHSSNDGAGSGLDADLLDGKHASDFLSITGGALTGHLEAGSNIGTAPANIWDNAQVEAVCYDAGVAAISLHRSGASHVALMHRAINQLTVNMNAGEFNVWHGGNLTVSATAPSAPGAGQLWVW